MQKTEIKNLNGQTKSQNKTIQSTASTEKSLQSPTEMHPQKRLSVTLSEHLLALLKDSAEDKKVSEVVSLAKELRELMRLNLDIKRWEER